MRKADRRGKAPRHYKLGGVIAFQCHLILSGAQPSFFRRKGVNRRPVVMP